jgi:hypothetical protein
MVGGNPNLIPYDSFERDADPDGVPDGWRFTPGATTPRLVDHTSHRGRRSIEIRNAVTATSGTFRIDRAVRPYRNYYLSAWFKSRNVLPTATTAGSRSPVAIRVEQLSGTGAVIATSWAYGYTNTADWNRQFVGFRTLQHTRSVRISGMLRKGSGTAWFDDVYLGELFRGGAIPVAGRVESANDGTGRLTQRADVPDHDLTVKAIYRPAAGHIRVDGVVTGTGRTNRAFQIEYTLPLDAEGWRWSDDARHSRRIGPGRYRTETTNLQSMSRYPFSAVYDDRSSLSLGIPLDSPRISRMRYDARGLSIAFDLGVSPAATRLGPRATFSFVIYTSAPDWGFRSATEKYYDLFSGAFVRRTDAARTGGWWFYGDLEWLDTRTDALGLGLNVIGLGKASNQAYATWGQDYAGWDNEHGVYASAYNHHWAFYHRRASWRLPTYDQAMDRLRSAARMSPETDADARLRDEARAALRSTLRDYNGRRYYERYFEYLLYYQNLDPLPSEPTDWGRVVQQHQVQRAIDLATAVRARLDGIHLDSTSGIRRWAAADNYNRRQWAATTTPLTFSYDSGLVTQRGIFPIYAHIRRLSTFARARGMIISANFNAADASSGGYIGADRIDYFGIERGLPERANPARGITTDGFAMFKRTMAYQKPISVFDLKFSRGEIDGAEIERRLQLGLFYGIFLGGPGLGAEWDGVDTSSIFGRYTPLFRTLAAAGWEPVTHARSSDRNVWVERFGSVSEDNLHLTLRNETGRDRGYTLTVDLDGGVAVRQTTATEMVSGRTVPVEIDASGTRAAIRGRIAAESTQVIRLDTSGAP